MVSPSNPYEESIGALVMPGRYVEVPLERPEYDLLVHLPMNEMLNINPVLADHPENEGTNRGSTVTFDRLRTPDLSGNYNVGVLTRPVPVRTKQRCCDRRRLLQRGHMHGRRRDRRAVSNSIFLGDNATIGFARTEKQVPGDSRSAGVLGERVLQDRRQRLVPLAFLPFVAGVIYQGRRAQVFLYGPSGSQAQEEEDVTLSTSPTGSGTTWRDHHGGWTLHLRGRRARETDRRGTRVFGDGGSIRRLHGQVGPPVSSTFQVDELYVCQGAPPRRLSASRGSDPT
jgi:hypothetical protein